MQSPRLTFTTADENRFIELGDEPCRIGRGAQNSIVLQSEMVSRNHAMVQMSESGAYLLFDLGSRNGTLLNGRRLAAPAELRDGDVIQIGDQAVTFSWPRTDDAFSDRWSSETTVSVAHQSIVVLVADLKNFTGLSVELGERKIAELIGAFNRKVGAVLDGAGVWTQKYIGDAVMAVWSPLPGQTPLWMLHSALSVVPAIGVAVLEVSEQFALDKPLRIGFGINTGLASIGNLGSAGTADHTALGNVVNKAFRLEACTRVISGDLAFSDEVYDLLAPVGIDGLGTKHRLVLKGYTTETDVYAVSCSEIERIVQLLVQHVASGPQRFRVPSA